jgi:hypothetical protein
MVTMHLCNGIACPVVQINHSWPRSHSHEILLAVAVVGVVVVHHYNCVQLLSLHFRFRLHSRRRWRIGLSPSGV